MSFLSSSAVKRDTKGYGNISSNTSTCDPGLVDSLAAVLPKGYTFGVYHLSTPPTKTEPLCSAPPGERPDKTYAENHFLAVTVDYPTHGAPPTASKRASPGADEFKDTETSKKTVLAFAIEIFVFTTAYQTTFFVSKADSTGYLQLLNLPKGTPSPIREVASTFLTYLLEHRRRKNIQSVVNLFARAQAQYLFPGSVENKGKHVLDDWGLVKWWCRVLNPLLEGQKKEPWGQTKGYLIVPGLEESEMRAFLPRTPASATNWSIGHPMECISHYTAEFDWVPPRCLIPHYPDDPKSRFRDELDDESSKWKQDMGSWKSVKSLDQFWEMMAFRQECSSGRLTGFIWLVFDPKEAPRMSQETAPSSTPQLTTPNTSFDSSLPAPVNPPATPPRRRVDMSARTPQSSPLKLGLGSATSTPSQPRILPDDQQKKKKKKLKGHIVPRLPKVKTQQRSYIANRPSTTAYYYWPTQGRGNKVVDESDFKRIVELLLHLDFATLDKATAATRRWISEAAMGAKWGQEVTGKRVSLQNYSLKAPSGHVNNLGSSGLVRRMNDPPGPANPDGGKPTSISAPLQNISNRGVNVLGAGLVRKKKKVEEDTENVASSTTVQDNAPVRGLEDGADIPKVNALEAGLVRKKAKPA
ncbi:histone acetylation protein-domain-containing protein [Podospora didyma]|uniref:histone acetyltransferase n=1 Tax=Podospora didyma TaxID=330526 RepID=A0AAE0KJ38_9PEZI|nr:histone acetylation protein-domain-containing protein [Podospora didyma]